MNRGFLTVLGLLMVFSFLGCGGGSDSNGTPGPTGSVSLTVSGTTVTAFSGDDAVSSDNTQGKSMGVDRDGDGINDAYQLTLRNIPLSQNLRIYLESKGAVYPLYFADGAGTTNVFSLGSEALFDFGFITLLKGTAGNSATPERSPCRADTRRPFRSGHLRPQHRTAQRQRPERAKPGFDSESPHLFRSG